MGPLMKERVTKQEEGGFWLGIEDKRSKTCDSAIVIYEQ